MDFRYPGFRWTNHQKLVTWKWRNAKIHKQHKQRGTGDACLRSQHTGLHFQMAREAKVQGNWHKTSSRAGSATRPMSAPVWRDRGGWGPGCRWPHDAKNDRKMQQNWVVLYESPIRTKIKNSHISAENFGHFGNITDPSLVTKKIY